MPTSDARERRRWQPLDVQRDIQLFSEPQRTQRLPEHLQFHRFDHHQQMARLAVQFARQFFEQSADRDQAQ